MYLSYGIFLLMAGLVGFVLTGAKSALISGAASGTLMTGLSFLVDKNKIAEMITKVLNLMFCGVFGWRFYLALQAVMAGVEGKLIAAILLGLMAVVSIFVAATAFSKGKKS